MKKIAAIVAMLIPLLAVGQITHSDHGQVDQKASEVLKKAAAQFDRNVGFTVKMTSYDGQKKQVGQHQAQVTYGRGKYRLVMGDQELICDGATVWHWNKKAKEVTVSDVENSEDDLLNPRALLSGYEKSFRPKYIRTDPDGSAVIDLQPKAARSYHKIRLLIEEKSGRLKSMEVHKYDSGREIYEVANFKVLGSIAPSLFVFDTKGHPEVEVIDMR